MIKIRNFLPKPLLITPIACTRLLIIICLYVMKTSDGMSCAVGAHK